MLFCKQNQEEAIKIIINTENLVNTFFNYSIQHLQHI